MNGAKALVGGTGGGKEALHQINCCGSPISEAACGVTIQQTFQCASTGGTEFFDPRQRYVGRIQALFWFHPAAQGVLDPALQTQERLEISGNSCPENSW